MMQKATEPTTDPTITGVWDLWPSVDGGEVDIGRELDADVELFAGVGSAPVLLKTLTDAISKYALSYADGGPRT